jgi:tetratricopeptide (TPR) repeat protein
VAEPTPGAVEWDVARDWAEASVIPAPIQLEAQQLLRAALGQPEADLEERFGPLEGLLAGDPPAGASPLRWRADVSEALERAMVRDPENPAPYLALARIRRKQGLREDARLLLGGGVERARRGTRPVSDRMAAELAFEYGRALKEAWLPWRNLGRLPVTALDGRACPRRAGPSGDVDAEILIAWNYLCSSPLGAALAEDFEPLTGGDHEREAMLRSLRDAVTVYPAHVGANVELLLDLADQGAWTQLLNQSRRFARATQGHPYALLMSGLALHRLARSEEALFDLRRGLDGLGDDARGRLTDVRVLLPAGQAVPDARVFWSGLDPLLSTEVNERELEHLARAAYAHLRFGDLNGDAARVWMRYGRPIEVRAFGSVSGLRTEFWDYGEGPDVTFTRPARSEEHALTPEARAYLDDLSRVYAHGVGPGAPARTVSPLPAQAARFRALQQGWVELEVALAIPEVLRAGAAPADSLELGLFLLGEGGRVLGEVRDRVAVRAGDIHWALPAAPEADRLVVELYNPRNHQAAGRSLALQDETAPTGPMSDLLLVAAGTPGEVRFRRSEASVTPLARTDRLDSDRVGLAFEVYDLPSGGGAYRVQVELVASPTGAVVPVAFRPQGEAGFRSQWTREPREAPPAGSVGATPPGGPTLTGGRVLEVLTLDLAPVPPGVYTLRARVSLPGGQEVVRERGELHRRLVGVAAGGGEAGSPTGLEPVERY